MGAALVLWGDTGELLPPLEYVSVDPSWLKLLPPGCKVIKTAGHGSSLFSQTGKIDVRLADGTEKSYFIKHTETEMGKRMAEGEYESAKLIHRVAGDFIPRPIGWGTYESSSDLHFYLAEFVDGIRDEMYAPMKEIARAMALLHINSQVFSPNAKYGFHVVTSNGPTPQYNKWTESWEEFFTETVRHMYRREVAFRPEPYPEMDELIEPFLQKVVPRLLRPLETGGNLIHPSIIHGDLFHGNTARFQATGKAAIFDPCSIWAHFEYDLCRWRGGRFAFDINHMIEYFKTNPPSEPRREWQDRSNLYFITSQFNCSLAWPNAPRYRQECVQNMKSLLAKFPDGYTGPHRRKGSEGGVVLDKTATTAAKVGEDARIERADSVAAPRHSATICAEPTAS